MQLNDVLVEIEKFQEEELSYLLEYTIDLLNALKEEKALKNNED